MDIRLMIAMREVLGVPVSAPECATEWSEQPRRPRQTQTHPNSHTYLNYTATPNLFVYSCILYSAYKARCLWCDYRLEFEDTSVWRVTLSLCRTALADKCRGVRCALQNAW